MSPSNELVLERKLLGAALDEPERSVMPAASTRRRPAASISALWSRPTTRQPICRTSSIATAAVPVATSSTSSPASASIRETRKRRQRGSWRARADGSSGRTSGRAARRALRDLGALRAAMTPSLCLPLWRSGTISTVPPLPPPVLPGPERSSRSCPGRARAGRAHLSLCVHRGEERHGSSSTISGGP